ncbi:MAG: hypothetical protein P2A85_15820 [Microcoleus anatoxicus]|uniref:hypothetical protein n=1 Tax=Microcoleus anatoxicus TaxID=2705319 RepID=UPI003672C7E0
MLFRQYNQVLLTSFLIVGLTGRASIAFNIIPPNPGATRFYRPESIYQIDKNRESRTEIDMGLWSEPLPHGGTSTFKNALSLWSSFKSEQGRSGWSFNAAAEDLKGSFEVITYQACSPKDGCGGASTSISDINETYRGVGSLFHLKYHPGKGDPQPGEGKLHWIQMVQANYGSNVAGASLIHGVPFIDNFNRKQNPYYDRPNSTVAGEDFFMDRPYNDVATRNNYFKAQLYLVQETLDFDALDFDTLDFDTVDFDTLDLISTRVNIINCRYLNINNNYYNITLTLSAAQFTNSRCQSQHSFWY